MMLNANAPLLCPENPSTIANAESSLRFLHKTITLRRLKADLLYTPRYFLFCGLYCRPVLSLLSSLDSLVTTSSLLSLLALLLGLLSRRLLGLFFLCLAGLFTSELLSPFLLLFGLDLTEEVTGSTDLVANGQRTCLPIVWDDKEFCVKLREDGGSSVRPVAQLAMCSIAPVS